VTPGAKPSRLGAALKALRSQKGLTLAEVSRRTGFSVPTLSKVENNRLSLSYDKLIRLSEGLDVGVAQLFVPTEADAAEGSGRRSVNRFGEWEAVVTANYDYRYLSTDIARKKFIPIVVDVRARSLEEFGPLVRHSGEEFIYILEGEVEVHTSLYSPLLLKKGESAYLDSSMGHAYLARGKGSCQLLAVCSAPERDLRAVTAEAETEAAGRSAPENVKQAVNSKPRPRRGRRQRNARASRKPDST
jgi:transcriptional regulator with XRE-family HTH domain